MLEGQHYKHGDMEGTGRYGKHHKKKKITLDGSRGELTKAGCTGHGLESGGEG